MAAPSPWPQFRGPNGSGIAETATPPVQFGPDQNVLWKAPLAHGYSSPILISNLVVLSSYEKDHITLQAFNAGTGEPRWQQEIPAVKGPEYYDHDPATSTPATDGERIFVHDAHGKIMAFDSAGHSLWQQSLPVSLSRHGSGQSPIVYDGRVILQLDQESHRSHVTVLDAQNGRVIWQEQRVKARTSQSTPVIWEQPSGPQLILLGSLYASAYRLADGHLDWTANISEPISIVPSPIVGDGLLFVMSNSIGEPSGEVETFQTYLAKFDKNHNGVIDFGEDPQWDRAWFDTADSNHDGVISRDEFDYEDQLLRKANHGLFAVRPGGQGDISSSSYVLWRYKKVPPVSSPLLYRGRLYLIDDGARLTSLNPKTGEPVLIQERLGVGNKFFASPVAADGRIYLCSEDGQVIVIAAGDQLKVLARNSVEPGIRATPALADSRLYLRTGTRLWCFGK